MNELVFKLSFVVLLVSYIVIRIPFDKQYKQIEKIKTLYSSVEKPLLLLLMLGLMVVPLFWSFTSLFDRFHFDLPIWLRFFGMGLSILSLFYFWWVHKTLGSNWSPTLEIRKDHELIKTGPYKLIRHPMYTQIWLWTIAQVLIVSNCIAGFSGILTWMILYFIRVPKEEKMLINSFGNKYLEYMKQTGRVLPKFRF